MDKLLIGPIEVSGFCTSLSNGFKKLGWETNTIYTGVNPFAYGEKGGSILYQLFQRAFDFVAFLSIKWTPLRIPMGVVRIVLKAILFVCILPQKQDYIFIFRQSLLPLNLDIPILRWLGRRTVSVYLGSDSRSPYLSGDRFILTDHESSKVRAESLDRLTSLTTRILSRIHRRFEWIVDNPMAGHLQPGQFLNWFSMGFPTIVPSQTAPVKPAWNGAGPLIIHAPSYRAIKGSDVIEKTLGELSAEGVIFRYRALSGVPNREVKALLAEAHIVIDQLYSDTPLAGLGTEGAAYGCAVVVGGYGWKECETLISPEMMPPSIKVDPENFKEDLRDLLTDEEGCAETGKQLHHFIKTRWDAALVAERYAAVLTEKIPDTWWVDPKKLGYTGGMGATKETIRTRLSELCAHCGKSSLRLTENPHLEEMIFLDYQLPSPPSAATR
jgi:hypothetical protein